MKGLKRWFGVGVAIFPAGFSYAEAQFTSRVYFVIQEPSTQQVQRSRQIIQQEFSEAVSAYPQLETRRFEVRSNGNQLVFSLVTEQDLSRPFQDAVTQVVGNVNGRARTRGGIDVFRTRLDEGSASGPSLEVSLDENTKIKSVMARSVRLRDLLAELQLQFDSTPADPAVKAPVSNQAFRSMVSSECNSTLVDWTYGVDGKSDPLSIDETMRAIAKTLGLRVVHQNRIYFFSGDCPQARTAALKKRSPFEFLPDHWISFPKSASAPTPEGVLPIRVVE